MSDASGRPHGRTRASREKNPPEPRSEPAKEFVVRWDGSSTIADPKSYFARDQRLHHHLQFLRKMRGLLEVRRQEIGR